MQKESRLLAFSRFPFPQLPSPLPSDVLSFRKAYPTHWEPPNFQHKTEASILLAANSPPMCVGEGLEARRIGGRHYRELSRKTLQTQPSCVLLSQMPWENDSKPNLAGNSCRYETNR